jgi:hypothetical protein
VRRIGLGLSTWAEQTPEQPDLFASGPSTPHPRLQRLDETLDAIREKFGEGALHRGLSRRSLPSGSGETGDG